MCGFARGASMDHIIKALSVRGGYYPLLPFAIQLSRREGRRTGTAVWKWAHAAAAAQLSGPWSHV